MHLSERGKNVELKLQSDSVTLMGYKVQPHKPFVHFISRTA